MSYYDIHPIEVQGVLSRTEVHLRDLDAAATKIGASLSSAATASGSAKVSGALNDWSKVGADNLVDVSRSGWSAVQGTGLAVVAYLKGDREMMRNAQHAAVEGVPYGQQDKQVTGHYRPVPID